MFAGDGLPTLRGILEALKRMALWRGKDEWATIIIFWFRGLSTSVSTMPPEMFES